MNFLFHLYLSDRSPQGLVGSLMGDYVKGTIPTSLPPVIRFEIRRHRLVDRFSQDHPLFRQSKYRLSPHIGLYRGVMVDLFYDHFLALHWGNYATMPLEEFAEGVYQALQTYREVLPAGMIPMAERMAEHSWLTSYRDPEIIGLALRRMSMRLRRSNPLHEGGDELVRHYEGLREDFMAFLPEVEGFAKGID